MTCEDLELRLYDEDCRRALLGHAPVPRDVADHLAGCAACREVWAEAARETVRLTRDLPMAPPPSLAENLAAATGRPAVRAIAGWDDAGAAIVAGAVVLIATALIPGAGPLWQWAGVWTGAACGFAASVLDRNVPLLPDFLPG